MKKFAYHGNFTLPTLGHEGPKLHQFSTPQYQQKYEDHKWLVMNKNNFEGERKVLKKKQELVNSQKQEISLQIVPKKKEATDDNNNNNNSNGTHKQSGNGNMRNNEKTGVTSQWKPKKRMFNLKKILVINLILVYLSILALTCCFWYLEYNLERRKEETIRFESFQSERFNESNRKVAKLSDHLDLLGAKTLLINYTFEDLKTDFKGGKVQDIKDHLNLLEKKVVLPQSCFEIKQRNKSAESGKYLIQFVDRFVLKKVIVVCDMTSFGGGWNVIQRRGQFHNPSDYFFRGWNDYFYGFGNLNSEFWMGLDNIQAMAEQAAQELLVQLWDQDQESSYALYDNFRLSDDGNFRLILGLYSGTAGDGLDHSRNANFSTKDNDLDKDFKGHCANILTGAWWYGSCSYSNLNGFNYNQVNASYGRGIIWGGNGIYSYTHSLFRTEMKIRPKKRKENSSNFIP